MRSTITYKLRTFLGRIDKMGRINYQPQCNNKAGLSVIMMQSDCTVYNESFCKKKTSTSIEC